MNNDESTKNPISNEILLNNKINDSFSFNMDLEQNYYNTKYLLKNILYN